MDNFTDDEFIEIINVICKKETSIAQSYIPIDSMDDLIDLDRLDSMGIMLFYVWLSELFELPEEAIEAFTTQDEISVRSLKEFVEAEGQRNTNYVEALQWTKECI